VPRPANPLPPARLHDLRHAEGVAAKFAQAVDGELDLDQDGDEDDGPDTAPRVPCQQIR